MNQRGFTIIELLTVIVLFAIAAAVAYVQFNTFQQMGRDDTRRTAVNAMYYNLEDIFYKTHSYYPETIDEKNLTAMDKALLTDPDGQKIGSGESDYRYEPINCEASKCKGYTLRTDLEKEADFVKKSRN
jgi:prepilin-type N-terminal cleavage/methylation domain-containing protein